MHREKIYLKIREYREKNNQSIDYVAIQMEISTEMYVKIEMGKVDLKISKLDKLVKILGLKKSEIFKLDC